MYSENLFERIRQQISKAYSEMPDESKKMTVLEALEAQGKEKNLLNDYYKFFVGINKLVRSGKVDFPENATLEDIAEKYIWNDLTYDDGK